MPESIASAALAAKQTKNLRAASRRKRAGIQRRFLTNKLQEDRGQSFGALSVTPGFNRVISSRPIFQNRFNGLPRIQRTDYRETVETVPKTGLNEVTRLKPGENENSDIRDLPWP